MQTNRKHTRHFPPLAWSRSGSKGPNRNSSQPAHAGSPSGQLHIHLSFSPYHLHRKISIQFIFMLLMFLMFSINP